MNRDLRRQYLAALGVSLWSPRRSLALQPEPAPPLRSLQGVLGAQLEPSASSEKMSPVSDDQEFRQESAFAPPRTAMITGMDWQTLTTAVDGCTACGLCASRTQAVFGIGDRQADWLIIGEAPGADEDRLGEPFVGRAGKLLNPMLQAIGLQRDQVFIANILKCRPPDNRDPTLEEAAKCRPFLNRQIALIQPRMILALGRIAAQNLLATDVPIGKLRGRAHYFGSTRIPLIVTYHPAYLLRSPREKRKAWDDLRLARRTLNAEPLMTTP